MYNIVEISTMGSSVSLPEIEGVTPNLPMPTMADTRIRGWFKKRIFITTTNNAQLWLVVLPRGYYGTLIFHDGPNLDDQVMALSHHIDFWRSKFELTLPSLKVTLHVIRNFFTSDLYWFDIPVGVDRVKERFEWRRSYGKEVQNLAFPTKGWKLVRLSTVDNPTFKIPRDEREIGFGSDGAQVVAVWSSKRIFSKKGHFELLLAGEKLGPLFLMVAWVSVLTLEINVIRKEHNRNCSSVSIHKKKPSVDQFTDFEQNAR